MAAVAGALLRRLRTPTLAAAMLAAGSSTRGFAAAAAAQPPASASATAPAAKDGISSVVIFGYSPCPYCNKTYAWLDAAGIPYTLVEVNPLTKGELLWSDYKKVPLAVINGRAVPDSNRIIDTLEELAAAGASKKSGAVPGPDALATLGAPRRVFKHATETEAKWRAWVDDRLVHVLTPNLYATLESSFASMDYLTKASFPVWSALPAKYIGAFAMYAIAGKLKKKHGIVDARGELFSALNELADAAAAGGGFLGGATPCLADVSAFGVLRAVAGLQVWADMMDPANTRIAGWYKAMEGVTGPSARTLRLGDAVPPMA